MSKWTLSLSLLAACAGKDEPPADDSGADDSGPADLPDEVELAGTCEDTVDYGGFIVDATEDYGYVTGQVLDGVVPLTLRATFATADDCVLLKKENPYCEPGCDPGYTCDFDGSCIPYPAAQDLGGVTVTGLKVEVAMSPVVPGYTYFDTSVPNPPYDTGALIRLDTEGGAFEPVSLYGYGVEPLATDTLDWLVSPGQPLELRWQASTATTPSEIYFTLQIDQHGITPLTAVCAFEDDGAGALPASLVDELFSQGVSGFPNGVLLRRTADAAAMGDGCVDLVISSSLVPTITVEGYTPCDEDKDCPDGQTCDLSLEICQ